MQTFEELINQVHFQNGEIVGFDNNQKEIILDLMKVVRRYTIKECIIVAEKSIYQSVDDTLKIGSAYFLQLNGLSVDTSL